MYRSSKKEFSTRFLFEELWGTVKVLNDTKLILNDLGSHSDSFTGNNYEVVVKFFHISHNLTLYSAIVNKFTRIYPVCSTYELTKQFM